METFITTVQIVLKPGIDNINSIDDVYAWVSELLSENNDVLDWQYLSIGGQCLYPSRIFISDDYETGEAFK